MNNWLLLPPITFLIILTVSILVVFAASKLAFRTEKIVSGKGKAYACGEDLELHRFQPDYAQFFPFAFFFTIIHVLTIIVATVPAGEIKIYGIAAVYLISVISGLFILFRR